MIFNNSCSLRPRRRNISWENWGCRGFLIGFPLLLFGILISICEIVRIIYGVTHRGMSKAVKLII
jgi:hypothetical protein